MKIIGHRGARGIAPENTLASLEKALEHHVDEIEFDLRVTADRVVILHHDKYVRDADGSKLRIAEHKYAELRQHKPDLTTFKRVLQDVGHKVPLYVEVKPKEPVQPIVDIVKTYLLKGWKPEAFLLASKSQTALLELHEKLPEVPVIVIEPWSGVRATRRAKQVDTKLIAMNQLWLWRGFITPMSRNGWKLYAYTLNSPIKAHRWARYGLYGAVTDFPDLMED